MFTNEQKELEEYCQSLYKEELKYLKVSNQIKQTLPKVDKFKSKKNQKLNQSLQKLLQYHEQANIVVDNKIEIASKSLQITQNLLKQIVAQELSRELPLFPGKSLPPQLCGKISPKENYITQPGDLVCAAISNNLGNVDWILCHVKSFAAEKQEYCLVDFFDENNLGPIYHTIKRNRVIPLPTSLSLHHLPSTEFEINSKVYAMYPDTTTFYPAKVLSTPGNRRTSTFQTYYYILEFEGDTVPNHDIYSRWVIPTPKQL
ncbi:saga-associated factor 29 [Anaeramoeba flamelloides]|uniref:Saga-associated factor n=2 Tax=Anaeramoeba flamelloides TaxID=1746091 RepID=A0AAV7ZS49_9EUKA|nr:saga-associated factor [Anaeramoeba flamelloides]KAJ6239085.1 saga-associated factor 29 [Anaeramoeba flamelloides]